MSKIILGLLILCVVINISQLTSNIISNQQKAGKPHLHNLGDQFKGLEPIFAHVRSAGYYTDKNIDEPLVIAQFEQAQYLLAPTVLDLNQTNYPLVIFDCSTPEIALNKIKELGFQPLKANHLGVILALNPQTQNLQP